MGPVGVTASVRSDDIFQRGDPRSVAREPFGGGVLPASLKPSKSLGLQLLKTHPVVRDRIAVLSQQRWCCRKSDHDRNMALDPDGCQRAQGIVKLGRFQTNSLPAAGELMSLCDLEKCSHARLVHGRIRLPSAITHQLAAEPEGICPGNIDKASSKARVFSPPWHRRRKARGHTVANESDARSF